MDFASQIVEPRLRDLFSRWEDKSVGGCVPTRADFDALSLPAELLPAIFILERREARFFCRLAGTGIRDLLDFEAGRRYLDDLIPLTHSISRGAVYARVMDEQIPAYFSGPLVGDRGDRPVSCLLLPVASQGGTADQVFGVLLPRAQTDMQPIGWVGPGGAAVVAAWAA